MLASNVCRLSGSISRDAATIALCARHASDLYTEPEVVVSVFVGCYRLFHRFNRFVFRTFISSNNMNVPNRSVVEIGPDVSGKPSLDRVVRVVEDKLQDYYLAVLLVAMRESLSHKDQQDLFRKLSWVYLVKLTGSHPEYKTPILDMLRARKYAKAEKNIVSLPQEAVQPSPQYVHITSNPLSTKKRKCYFWNPPAKWWSGNVDAIPSDLSGSHGEWTMGDDLDANGHRQGPRRANLINRGARRRGGNGHGPPPGPRPRHPDNRAVHSDDDTDVDALPPQRRGDVILDPKPPDMSEHQFHSNGIGAGLKGSLGARVAQESLLDRGRVALAGSKLGEYNASKYARELELAVGNVASLNAIHMSEVNREVLKRDLLAQQSLASSLRVEQADLARLGAKARAKAAAEEVYHRATKIRLDLAHQESQERLSEIARRHREEKRDMHRLERELRDEDRHVANQIKLRDALEDAHSDLSLLTDPELLALSDARVAAEGRRYRRQLPDLLDIAHAEHAIAAAKEGGQEKDRRAIKAPINFVRNPRWDEIDDPQIRCRLPWLNPEDFDRPDFRSIDVDLVPGILFVRHKRPGMWAWLGCGLAYSWKKTVSVRRPDGTLGHANVAPTNAQVLFGDNGMYHGTLNLLKSDDRRICRDVLNDYRILGIQSGDLQAILNDGAGFIVEHKFTHAQPVLVHPTLYQAVHAAATGVSVTKNQAAGFIREFKDPWLRHIQTGLFNDTVNLALQHAQIYNSHRSRTLAKTTDVLGDL